MSGRASLARAISAGLPRKLLRDRFNRLRYGPEAPLSDERLFIDPMAVRHWYRPDPARGAPRFRRRHSGRVVPGDWDLSRAPFGPHLKLDSLRAHFEDGMPWEETPLFAELLARIEAGERPDDCASREDLLARYALLDRVYEEARRNRTLRPHGEVNDTRREHGGILVHIARDGEVLRAGGGMHRFAIARLLQLPEIPVQLGVVHPDAVKAGLLARYRRPGQG